MRPKCIKGDHPPAAFLVPCLHCVFWSTPLIFHWLPAQIPAALLLGYPCRHPHGGLYKCINRILRAKNEMLKEETIF